jgi:endogenous inhibitor of DNA gyrase (YacG/DUF329 family)
MGGCGTGAGRRGGEVARMFFIGVFGIDTRARPLGVTSPTTCPRCRNAAAWTILETSRRFTFFFIPIVGWGRRYLVSCPICGETTALGSREEALGLKAGEFTG